MIRGSNPGKDKRFYLLQIIKAGSVAHPASSSMGTGILYRGKKASISIYLPPSSAEVKNE
jgi:hypothetical protein